jgi:hypothetical protein
MIIAENPQKEIPCAGSKFRKECDRVEHLKCNNAAEKTTPWHRINWNDAGHRWVERLDSLKLHNATSGYSSWHYLFSIIILHELSVRLRLGLNILSQNTTNVTLMGPWMVLVGLMLTTWSFHFVWQRQWTKLFSLVRAPSSLWCQTITICSILNNEAPWIYRSLCLCLCLVRLSISPTSWRYRYMHTRGLPLPKYHLRLTSMLQWAWL